MLFAEEDGKMKITVVLRNDHESVKALFARLVKPSGAKGFNGRKDMLNEISRELSIHSQVEQEIFYPALSSTSSSRCTELVTKAEEEHDAIEKLLQELGGMNGSEKTFEGKVDELRKLVEQHVEMEEGEMFDEARKNLPEYRLEELGLELEDRKKILGTLAA
jgi:hemerythrin superfamily protein